MKSQPSDFIIEYVDVDFCNALSQMEKTVIGLSVIRHEGDEREAVEDVGIIIEGVTVIKDLKGCCHCLLSAVWPYLRARPPLPIRS